MEAPRPWKMISQDMSLEWTTLSSNPNASRQAGGDGGGGEGGGAGGARLADVRTGPLSHFLEYIAGWPASLITAGFELQPFHFSSLFL